MTITRVALLLGSSVLALAPLAAGVACGGAQSTVAPPSSLEPGVRAVAPPGSASVTHPLAATQASESRGQAGAVAPDTSPAAAPAGAATAPGAADPSTVQELFDDTTRAHAAALKAKPAAGDPAAPLVQGLSELAKRAAPGMDPDGPLATGTLQEKQSLQADVTFLPGRCYAILGYSREVKDVDLFLLLPPGILAGQDGTKGSTSVIGDPAHPICPVAAAPVTYKLRIVADQGAGDVAVQVYSKAR
jgi:hypothetical protein